MEECDSQCRKEVRLRREAEECETQCRKGVRSGREVEECEALPSTLAICWCHAGVNTASTYRRKLILKAEFESGSSYFGFKR